MSDEALRVGLIGYGLAGSVFHAPLIQATKGLTLAAVVTSDQQRGAEARDRYPAAALLTHPDQLWEGALELDAIVIATPNKSHVPLATTALEAAVAVIVDKPLAPTSAQGQQLVDRAAADNVALTVFQNRRWDGDFLTVKALVAGGELGAVHRFESRFERWAPTPKVGWREDSDPEMAAGLLFDLGAHLIDQALSLFGPVAAVYAERDRRRAGVAVDDDTFIALTHSSGVRSHLWASSLTPALGPRFRVLGDRAGYTVEGLDPQEPQLKAGGRPGDQGFGAVAPERFGRISVGDNQRIVPTKDGAYLEFYQGFAAALRDGTPVPVDPRDAVAALRIIEAAGESAARGVVVQLPTEVQP